GQAELVRLLLDHGADLAQTTDDGRRPLDFALAGGHNDVAALLRERRSSH
ncbi:MAG: ankyrin repeat domain-containing protein, partial [Anaerolineales bacterium]|nr:ankyrin repeat domain-containing protein [Anaerolineales bacterium]